jgi:CheY-like chemotaxis protein
VGDSETTSVLVADADEGTRSLVRLTLDGESYDVAEAEATEPAILRIAAIRPRLILLDAELPGAGGLALARSLKQQPETSAAAVVLLHDKGAPIDEDGARDAGVDEFLAKPFTAFALLKKVDGLLGDDG